MKTPSVSEFREHQIIPHPCYLSWQDLNLKSNGVSHCSECDCEVRDLTDMSSDEIYALQKELGGKLCGMIYKKNNYVLTEVMKDPSGDSEDQASLFSLPIPKVLSAGLGGIAALSMASCSTPEPPEVKVTPLTANPFPKDDSKKEVRGTKKLPEPECLLGIVALPPKS